MCGHDSGCWAEGEGCGIGLRMRWSGLTGNGHWIMIRGWSEGWGDGMEWVKKNVRKGDLDA